MRGVTGSSAFSRFKRKRGKSTLIEWKKCPRLNQKSKCDDNGNLAYTVLVNCEILELILKYQEFSEGAQKFKTGYAATLGILH